MPSRRKKCTALLVVAATAPATRALAAPDLRFDIVPFQTTKDGSNPHFVQNNFDHINVSSSNGRYMALGTDTHRPETLAAGNQLAVYYNNFNADYSTGTPDPATEAAAIENYCQTNFTHTGAEPDWVILNEISGSQWPNGTAYRDSVTATVSLLHNTYHHDVILYAPFTHPGANAADWTKLAGDCYIAVEDYLSGSAMKAQNFSVAWATQQYLAPKPFYAALGVPADRLMLGEHFANTTAGTGFGRDGVSSADWTSALTARDAAAYAADYAGFLSFAWDKNQMLIPEAEQITYEDTYASQPVLHSETPVPEPTIPAAALLLVNCAPVARRPRRA